MVILPKRRIKRNSQSLPLFEWADRQERPVFEPLLVTTKLARKLRISPSVLNVMAEANGYVGREGAHG